ncbi:LodA/GoxA family CTQ-dependent oxidase [Sinorhizobium medicae]|uniref:LodA/GoxA family CTQ-dependent oxidase n=1 Tax=Sinorhizobium medicae TaxID=110321 RepID=UPI0013E3AF27|nr:LodA/GoxA family CTQ-dependent oxidase [Sinorhizobium medicae]
MAAIAASNIDWIGVYPPIGIARVGNATGENDYTLAPEVIAGPPDARGGFQTSGGAIKRQAVLFRVYARLKSGETIELVHGDGVSIEWRVELANLKAGWYQFNQAMDLLPEFVVAAERRNADHGRRVELDIRPSPRRISGTNISGPGHRFDDGQLLDRHVTLGELRTDGQGRLLFLGGRGLSSPFYRGMRPLTFANNDRWHDDVSDGPVRASISIDGTVFEADPGYVVVTPPNYAPGLTGLVTMDDTVRETFMESGWLKRPDRTSFTHDVWPIFHRLTRLQWINHGFLVAHGVGSPLDAEAEHVNMRLSDGEKANRAWRQRVFALFRRPDIPSSASQRELPYIYGDLFGETNDGDRTFLTVTPTMYAHLEHWADGNFEMDWRGPPTTTVFNSLPPDQQVAHLTRTGLTECLGGPFHPGIEMSWPMRRPELWALFHRPEAGDRLLYRLNLIPEGTPVRQDFGISLTRDACLGLGGAVDSAGPGALTRWLGVPWQTDEASCNSSADYSPSTYLSFPSFWGARVPEQVLSMAAYARASDEEDAFSNVSTQQRLKHAFYREDWLRDVRGRTYYERIDNMVQQWNTLGVIEPVRTTAVLQSAGFPQTMHVETGRDNVNAGSDEKRALIALIESLSGDIDLRATAGAVPETPPIPPRRSFRQGEV